VSPGDHNLDLSIEISARDLGADGTIAIEHVRHWMAVRIGAAAADQDHTRLDRLDELF
jgi:hypothetical protein